MDKGLLETARMGEKVTAAQYFDAIQKRGALGVLMNRFHQTYDLLVTPTLPLAAFTAGKEVANLLKEKRWTDWSPFSYPFNLTQQPAAIHSLRPHEEGPAGRPAHRRPALRRRARAARRARVRVDESGANARSRSSAEVGSRRGYSRRRTARLCVERPTRPVVS